LEGKKKDAYPFSLLASQKEIGSSRKGKKKEKGLECLRLGKKGRKPDLRKVHDEKRKTTSSCRSTGSFFGGKKKHEQMLPAEQGRSRLHTTGLWRRKGGPLRL